MILRVARWAWPLLFLVPLTLVADRACRVPGVDPAYHFALWLHENLPVLYVVAALLAAFAVALRIARARARAATLFSLASDLPAPIGSAFAAEAVKLAIAVPKLVYLDIELPLCFALVGVRPTVVLSRGFVAGLEPDELSMVAHHELVHVKHRDPLRGFAWHLAFAALLMPAFTALERWLGLRRELRTNLETAADDPERYAALLVSRARERRGLCAEAFGGPPRSQAPWLMLGPPAVVVAVLIALAASHAWFMEHLAYLSTHHC